MLTGEIRAGFDMKNPIESYQYNAFQSIGNRLKASICTGSRPMAGRGEPVAFGSNPGGQGASLGVGWLLHQNGAKEAISTSIPARRARSSPRHACWLKVALFLHPCGGLQRAQAVRLLPDLGRWNACESLRVGPFSGGGRWAPDLWFPGDISGKGNFGNFRCKQPWNPRRYWAVAITVKGNLG